MSNFTTYAYNPSVKMAQERYGARKNGARMEQSGDRFILTETENAFIASRDSFYIASAGENGWPYVQHRGGPPGFLRVLDDRTLAFADFRGNRQYITTGNVDGSEKASLFLMDYPSQQRLKIWAEAKVVDRDENPELIEQLNPDGYGAKAERAFVLTVKAYDWNCPQHITPRFTAAEIEAGLAGPEAQNLFA
ncbi:MAG: putative pyridoxine 5'-phosphate oxidase superfamily flavin-nucleotide-binding protein [Verrucomicrobiales bacterium]|jgi:predicted pyridoxine 5'-phosphate oxidase superfamily flavin-nucleotide-binding protein